MAWTILGLLAIAEEKGEKNLRVYARRKHMGNFYEELLEAAQIKRGDILDVVSDLFSVMLRLRELNEKFDANQLLDALKEAVGEEGTVLIRTFNWDFCHGVPFHYKTTPSRVGALGNVALKRPDFKRTKHPLYSWCVWGKEQEFLTEIDPQDAFGDDSILAYLEDHDAILLRIGDTQVFGLTSIHRAEQRANISERFLKYFTGQYTGSDGIRLEKTYSMFVRHLEYGLRVKNETIVSVLQKKGAISQYEYQGVSIDKTDLKTAGKAVYQDILSGRWGDWVECTKSEKM